MRGDELPKAEGQGNLTVWLHHLEAHPGHDVDCTLKVRTPLSYLTRLMIKGSERTRHSPFSCESCWNSTGMVVVTI